MNIIQVVAIGLVATVLIVTLREERPEISILMSIVTGVLIFIFIIDKVAYVIEVLKDLSNKANLDFIYFTTIVKVIGIAYVCEFGAQIAKDAGEGAIATKIELAGKVMILVISIPILLALLELIIKIMP
ncbi:stage III sporulation protein AD [Clostridium sp. D2Q-11]|uniref:Stage III sporulation protein AD n=1 Tax=Anaeromonas frigoriresistens TaxID=2683708 RepID=A0A942ZA50_9FIRM|nr:stage III sporulation protein AD [Anaeromonas frigoriresistens]MBS4539993.1 stage III sporulation protein AD [Anaeromonas frigoriresistens]